MTLSDATRDLDKLPREHTIYAVRPWKPSSRAIVAEEPSDGALPEAVSASDLAYFLEVSIARDFLSDWIASLPTAPSREEQCERLIDYAEHDA